MPGPGGGGRGGGGSFGGGGFGGGGRGGGFGGGFGGGPRGPRRPHHHHWHYHRPHFWGGWFFRPYYYGGGMYSGILFVLILPIIAILVAGALLIVNVTSAFSIAAEGGVVVYNEEKLQDYADVQYAAEFSQSTAYEDNLLLVVLTDEDKQEGYYIAWVGDHIDYNVNYMFGGEGSTLGTAMNKWINTQNYKYSLDSNLAGVVNEMRDKIVSRGYDSYTCTETNTGADSHLTNKTDLPLTASTVNTALERFTEDTGIPIVVVVEDAEDVFGKSMPASTIFTIVISAAVVIVGAVVLVRAISKRRRAKPDKNIFDDYDGSGSVS